MEGGTPHVRVCPAGRRWSASLATLPGYHAGRVPRNKGQRYPADPPTVEEIVAVVRQTADNRHGWRVRGLIVVLWRAGLRVQEALELVETDLDERHGSSLSAMARAAGGARSAWTRGRGAAAPAAGRPRRAAGRAAVLSHRRTHP